MALPHARLDDAVLDWVDCFASSKRSPRADLPVVADQTRDYRQKVTAVAVSFEDAHQRPMLVSDLFTPAPEELLRRRRHPHSGAPLRRASRNAYRRVLSAFVTFLRENHALEGVERIPWKIERIGRRDLTVFEPWQIEAMFMHLAKRDTIANRRMAAFIALGLDFGGRRCDVLSMRISKLDLDRRRAIVWVKNDTEIEVPLGEIAVVALRRYLAVRVDAGRHDLVFLNTAGTAPFTGDNLSKAFRRLLVTLGFVQPVAARAAEDVPPTPERLNFQALRRTFVKHYINAGRSERQLTAILGWDPRYAHQVFEYYTKVGIEELEAVHASSSPLNRLLRPE